MVRALRVPPAWALKRMRPRSPPSRTICSASSSALLPAPLGAMIAVVGSRRRVYASNRKNCTRCTLSRSCIFILREYVLAATFVAVVLIEAV